MRSRSGRGRGRARDERGVALLVSILVIALLATLTFEMSYTTLIDMNVARNVGEDTRLVFLAEAGIGVARSALVLDRKNNETDNLSEIWSEGAPIRALPLGDAVVAIDIVDEESKIPLNALVATVGEEVKVNEAILASVERLLASFELEPEIAEAIVDWEDPDDLPYGRGGAESLYYKDLKSPYPVRNGPFATLEELRLVKGITAEVFGKVSPFVTVYSTSGKVNVNTASQTVLMAMSDEIDERGAQDLIEFRAETPFESAEKVKDYLDEVSPPLTDSATLVSLFDVKSENFTILSRALLLPPVESEEVGGGSGKGKGEAGKGLEGVAKKALSGASGLEDAKKEEQALSARQKAARAGNTKSILAVLKRGGQGKKGELLYWRVD